MSYMTPRLTCALASFASARARSASISGVCAGTGTHSASAVSTATTATNRVGHAGLSAHDDVMSDLILPPAGRSSTSRKLKQKRK
jgi:hypothetical protein